MRPQISLRMALLDQQIVDSDGRPIGRVDDLRLHLPRDGGPPSVTALLTGAQALGERLGGRAGAAAAGAARRLRAAEQPAGPPEISAADVAETGSFVRLGVPLRELTHVAELERWLAHHLVERLPGSGDAGE